MSSAYVLTNERFNLRIVMLEINALLLHEETIPELLKQLTWLKNDRRLNHQIVIDPSHV